MISKAASHENSTQHGYMPRAIRLSRLIDVCIKDRQSSITLRAAIADVSETGMRILCDQYLAPKTRFLFTMLDQPGICAVGEVRWTKPAAAHGDRQTIVTEKMQQSGVKFVSLTPEHQNRLTQFLDVHVAAAA